MIVQDGAAYGRVHEAAIVVHGIGVDDLLVVIGAGEIDDFARVAQTNGRQGFHFASFERHQDFIDVGKGAPFALCAGFAFGQVVDAKHHVLRGHGDRLA